MNTEKRDIHRVRYFASVVTVSDGKVRSVTVPAISSCPVAGALYKGLRGSAGFSEKRLKAAVRKVIEGKIAAFGFFTRDRSFSCDGAAIPYGASEIMAHGLVTGRIDCAVMVCDGAGTVVTRSPDLARGIGARMHSVLSTSMIPEVVDRLYCRACQVVFNDGTIDQCEGVREAAVSGYDRIAVTVNGYRGEALRKIRAVEKECGVSVTILMTCTTGVGKERVDEMAAHADLVWACRSTNVRRRMEKRAIGRLSDVSPVYVLTKRGEGLAAGYRPGAFLMRKGIRMP